MNKPLNPEPQTRNYHHGNLKEALISAFLELLETTPFDKISLRKLATHLGVAATAVYNHFQSKDELYVAIKIQCLYHFAEYLNQCTLEIVDPKERIKELGKAYFRYSLEHTQIFYFIMSDNIPPELVNEDIIAAAMEAESALRAAVVYLLESNNLPSSQYNEGLGAFACWSMAHGITTLAAKRVNAVACAQGRWPKEFVMENFEQVNNSFDAMTDVLVEGILHAARRTGD